MDSLGMCIGRLDTEHDVYGGHMVAAGSSQAFALGILIQTNQLDNHGHIT